MKSGGHEIAAQELMLVPGNVCLPSVPTQLCAVVGAGAVLTVFDRRRKRGGMANYARPYREKGVPSTAKYAAPAIVTLVRMLLESGSVVADLETHLIGGGSNPEAEGYQEGLGDQNVKVGLELLDKLNLSSVDMDVGGNWGRKVVFHSATGELVLARVERIRSSDWYPQ